MATKTIEKRVSDLEEMIEEVPRIVNLRFSFIRAQLDTLDARVGTVEAKLDKLVSHVSSLDDKVSGLSAQMEALPRVLAEMLDERAKKPG